MSRWLQAHRRRTDARPWQRAGTCWTQAVLVLRWLTEGTDLRVLARDARLSVATAYRHLHEAIDVLAAQAPDLTEVLDTGRQAGWSFVGLDGTLIETSRCSARSAAGHDLWYSGKHHRHGGNIQVVTDPTGFPVWVSDVEPGSTHDLTAAREHALPALYPAAADGLPTLADKGYTGAGIGIHVPLKGASLAIDNHTRNLMLTALRAPTARGHFPTEQAALKTLYLVTRGMDPKGTGQARWAVRWKPALNAFAITFAGRMPAAETL